jgi:hypothetical protein
LGAAIDIDPAMARKLLKKNGSVMYRTSFRSLSPDEIQSPTEQKEREEFDAVVEKKYGLPMNEADFKYDPDYAEFITPTYDFYEDDEVPSSKMPYIDDVKSQDDVDIYDQYVGAQVRVPISASHFGVFPSTKLACRLESSSFSRRCNPLGKCLCVL